MKILVTGGAGYVGSVLVPLLLSNNHQVVVYDSMYFGESGIAVHSNLDVVKGDIRDTSCFADSIRGCDAIIHLACIANDPSFELNSELSKSINFDCVEPMVEAAIAAGVKRFIFASSSSVYGISDAEQVTEDHPLLPITDYNKYKGLAEPVILKKKSAQFIPIVVRPATICGYSPRLRLDLTVNILTNWAVNKNKIKIFGGKQKRPNIHIQDICELYLHLLDAPEEKVSGEIFNAGYQNLAVAKIAEIIRKVVREEFPEAGEIEMETTESDDIRSYHICSDKLERVLGWTPKRAIEDAVRELCCAFKEGLIPESFDNPVYFNVTRIKQLELA